MPQSRRLSGVAAMLGVVALRVVPELRVQVFAGYAKELKPLHGDSRERLSTLRGFWRQSLIPRREFVIVRHVTRPSHPFFVRQHSALTRGRSAAAPAAVGNSAWCRLGAVLYGAPKYAANSSLIR